MDILAILFILFIVFAVLAASYGSMKEEQDRKRQEIIHVVDILEYAIMFHKVNDDKVFDFMYSRLKHLKPRTRRKIIKMYNARRQANNRTAPAGA